MLLSVLLTLCVFNEAAAATIDSSDGGYSLVVAIHNSVQPNVSIIDNIKRLLIVASEFLFHVSFGMVFFKHVTIAVPETWPDMGWKEVTGDSLFHRADIRVKASSGGSGSLPFTRHRRGCGERGDYIQMVPAFLNNINDSAADDLEPSVYSLISEWAHFRYGVLEVQSYPGDEGRPLFCEDDSKAYIFCTEANNAQNYLTSKYQVHTCGKTSSWSAINENEDFEGLVKTVSNENRKVTFREVYEVTSRGKRTVFLVDISSRTMKPNQFETFKRAALYVIKSVFLQGDRLSIVSFNQSAKVSHALAIVDPSTRDGLAKAVGDLALFGDSCISCGLLKAIEVLRDQGESSDGATVFFVVGDKSQAIKTLTDIIGPLLKENIVVNGICIGNGAIRNLYRLSDLTGGKTFTVMDETSQVALEAALSESTYLSLPEWQRPVVLLETSETFVERVLLKFTITHELGNNTLVRISSDLYEGLHASLISEAGQDCSGCAILWDDDTSFSMTIMIPSPAQPGTWQLLLRAHSRKPVNIGIRVTSCQKDRNEATVRASCYFGRVLVSRRNMPTFYVQLTKGESVVLGARVVAKSKAPGTTYSEYVPLHDDGLGKTVLLEIVKTLVKGPDLRKDDGIYSAFLFHQDKLGTHAVQVQVQAEREGFLRPNAFYQDTAIIRNIFKPLGVYRGLTLLETTTEYLRTIPTYDWDNPVPNIYPKFGTDESGGFVVLEEFLQINYAPYGIRDIVVLQERQLKNGTLLATLWWTALGAYVDTYRASFLEIRVDDNKKRLENNFTKATLIKWDDLANGSLIPDVPYANQTLTLIITEQLLGITNVTVHIGIRVWNDQKRVSKLSNIVNVTFVGRQEPETSVSSTFTLPGTTTVLSTTARRSSMVAISTPTRNVSATPRTTPSSTDPQKESLLALIFFSIFAFLVLSATVCVVAYVIVNHWTRKTQDLGSSTPRERTS